jgi:hypothetical protein
MVLWDRDTSKETDMATKVSKGFAVTCPYCKDEESEVVINLRDLNECKCSGCDETFDARQARDLARAELARWELVVRWIELAEKL